MLRTEGKKTKEWEDECSEKREAERAGVEGNKRKEKLVSLLHEASSMNKSVDFGSGFVIVSSFFLYLLSN